MVLISLSGGSCVHRTSDPYPHSVSLYAPEYAQGFYMNEDGNNRILYVKKSWLNDDKSYFTYLLYPRSDSLLYKGKADHIPYPIKNVVCLSTTHIAYLESLGKSDMITGVSGAQYISNQKIQEGISLRKVVDVGYEAALNYEVILSLHPDVVFAYTIPGATISYLKPLTQMGVPVVYLSDYLETHPLGKAEYMVALSAFFDSTVMEHTVASFKGMCSAYTDLCNLTRNPSTPTDPHDSTHAQQHTSAHDNAHDSASKSPHTSTPKILMNAPFKEVWYIPGGDSYMTKLIHDAGGTILGSKERGLDSQPISLEQAYLYALEADFWLHPNAFRTLRHLADSDVRFAQIPAFKAHRVYNNTLRSTSGGGSDFWERGVTEPHLILADLIKIFHPELLREHEFVYYEQLKEE